MEGILQRTIPLLELNDAFSINLCRTIFGLFCGGHSLWIILLAFIVLFLAFVEAFKKIWIDSWGARIDLL
jgi:hypothetical protein